MAQLGPIPEAAVRDTPPDVDDFGLVVRMVGGVIIVGPIVVNQGTSPWIVSDPPVEAALDVNLSTRASEATLLAAAALLAAVAADTAAINAALDVPLSSRASEGTLTAVAASIASIDADIDVPLSTRASEATLVAAAASLASIDADIDVPLSSRASEATLLTRASEATLLTRVADVTVTARLNTLGQKVMAASAPVVIASDQSPVPVTGSVIATNASIGVNGAVAPTSSTQTGGPDAAGNLEAARVHDLDTGAGTEFNTGVSLRKASAGGSVELGTLADPIRVDPTGTTPQPITGALTDAELRAAPVPVTDANIDVLLSTRASEATLAVATGALLSIDADIDVPLSSRASEATLATRASEVTLAAAAASLASIDADIDVALSTRASEATLATRASEATLITRLADATFTARINTLGQKVMAASTPVVIASDQTAIPVSGSVTTGGLTDAQLRATPVPVSGTVGVVGTVAHDSPDSVPPVKIGAKAESSLATVTPVADGDVTDLYADIDGVQVTKALCPFGDILNEAVINIDGVSTALTVFGATANARNMISTISVINTSSTNGYIDFRDGIAGAVLFRVPIPATGGAVLSLPVPLRQPTTNTALAFDVSAALTTVYISLIGFKSKV